MFFPCQHLLWSFPLCNHLRKGSKFNPPTSIVLSNTSLRTSKYFIPLLSFASLSTYAKSIHQISILYLANALIRLNLRFASVNFVEGSFECKTVYPWKLLPDFGQSHMLQDHVYIVFENFVAEILKGIQFPLSFALAFWLSTIL